MLEVAIEKALGDFRLNLNISCETRGIIAVFGRSGCGKTSLVNLLAGLLRPDRGRIAVDGRVLFDSARGIDVAPERRRLGYVFQEGRLFPHLDVAANLHYGYRRAAADRRRLQPGQVITLLGLEALLGRRPRDLSGGEKQRVALGRALLANPQLLLMDEPLAALDQARKDEVLPFIETLHGELAIPIVYVTHSMDEILRLADSMILMADGEVAAQGPVEELTARLDLRPLTGRYEAGAVLTARVTGIDRRYGLSELNFAGGRLRVPGLDVPLGSRLRIRVRARDVALALEAPSNSSFQNVFPARVIDIGREDGAQVDIRLDVNGAPLWARITARACDQLALVPGSQVYALIKTAAIDRHSLGRIASAGRFVAPMCQPAPQPRPVPSRPKAKS